ncbi:hypothetical protein [Spirosoma radiotolerans]|uniref:hypothetical protein n=1 Tax=Spirosoma radiotolerans TaxID=1379870 RepID=UPI00061CF51A|nr:hypothetical protein [Spirosoma radiotolerans]
MQSAIPSSIQADREQSTTRSVSWRLGIPTYIYAVVFSSLCVVWGLIWDIMWHISIGRDGLLAPPHALIYIGAILSGLFSAYQILNLTLTKKHPGRASAVPFWGVFYGSLGAMFSVWGALAMLTSAPFDDWWHNTYGLDVQILTPPHTILAIGIMTVQFGAMVGVLALQNQYRTPVGTQSLDQNQRATRLKWLFAISAALVLTMLFVMASATMSSGRSHHSSYYITAAIVFPFFLLAVGRASLLRWPITIIAGLYFLAQGLPSWIIQNFPATPRLGPVLNPITHYQPFHFPMLLIVPAVALDWLMHRFDTTTAKRRKVSDWVLAGLYATAFLVALLIIQWPFGEFLHTSPYARNGFFLGYTSPYNSDPNRAYRFIMAPWYLQTAADFGIGFAKALLYATLSARIGLLWGNWMKRIVR